MRSLKAVLGLAVMALILAGCGGAGSSGSSASASSPSTPVASGSGSGTPPTTGNATLRWTAPTTNSDGTPLTDLAGYYIYYGSSDGAFTHTVNVTSPATVSYVVTNLSSGTWYFAISAYTNTGLVSPQSNVGSKTIT